MFIELKRIVLVRDKLRETAAVDISDLGGVIRVSRMLLLLLPGFQKLIEKGLAIFAILVAMVGQSCCGCERFSGGSRARVNRVTRLPTVFHLVYQTARLGCRRFLPVLFHVWNGVGRITMVVMVVDRIVKEMPIVQYESLMAVVLL